MISRIGNDARGRAIVAATAQAGVSAAGFQVDDTAATRGILVTTDARAERSFAGFDGCAPFADELLDADAIDAAHFCGAAWFAGGSPALAAVRSRSAIARCLEYCRMNAVPVAADVNRRDLFWSDPQDSRALIESMLLETAALLKATQEEAQWLFGNDDAARILEALPAAQLVVITRGERGGSYATRTACGTWPAFAVGSVDTTGAGDAFLGALLHALALSQLGDASAVGSALVTASAAGAMTTRAPGALQAQPDSDGLRAFLRECDPEIIHGNAG